MELNALTIATLPVHATTMASALSPVSVLATLDLLFPIASRAQILFMVLTATYHAIQQQHVVEMGLA
jgi:hypothetical protein